MLRRSIRRQTRSSLSILADSAPLGHVTEKLLNHVSGTVSGVEATYNRYSYAKEMREAIGRWESHLQSLLRS